MLSLEGKYNDGFVSPSAIIIGKNRKSGSRGDARRAFWRALRNLAVTPGMWWLLWRNANIFGFSGGPRLGLVWVCLLSPTKKLPMRGRKKGRSC